MAGKIGFSHRCTDLKVEKEIHRSSLRDSTFSSDECDLIWDFYVAKSFAASTQNSIAFDAYGWASTKDKKDGLPALEAALAKNAGINSFCIIRANSINETLNAMDLSHRRICVSHSRAVLMQAFSYKHDENEQVTVDSKESRINAIFRHIRNAFAHGNTYFFDNKMCLLEDKDGSKITSEIVIPMQSLLDWIYIVDRYGVYYPK